MSELGCDAEERCGGSGVRVREKLGWDGCSKLFAEKGDDLASVGLTSGRSTTFSTSTVAAKRLESLPRADEVVAMDTKASEGGEEGDPGGDVDEEVVGKRESLEVWE